MISASEFEQLTPQLKASRRAEVLPPLQRAFEEFGICTYLREAAAIGQFLHESGGFQWAEELSSGSQYEGRCDLGNTQRGDGRRYKGRGWIQVTGRHNYCKYGKLLGIDLVGNPELAETVEHAPRIAGAYWKLNGLNELADVRRYKTITRRINGGLNGYADRLAKYSHALRVLSDNDPVVDDDEEEPVQITVRGVALADDGYKDDRGAWAPLRALTVALGWTIVALDDDSAHVSTPGGEVDAPFTIRGGRGFALVRPLAERAGMRCDWCADPPGVTLS